MDFDHINKIVDGMRDEIVDTCAELIKFPTVCTTGQNYYDCAEYIAEQLKQDGLDVNIIEVPRKYLEKVWGKNLEKAAEYLKVETFAPRYLVVAEWAGKASTPNLHLTQHYDVTQPRGNTFEPSLRNGMLIGKGASQSRASTAAQIMAVRALRRAGFQPKGTLYVSATPDNHIGGETGAKYMTEQGYGKSNIVITGGPSGPDVITLGYKGFLWVRITVHGKSAHGSEPQEGINAIEKMMKIQQELQTLSDTYKGQVSQWPIFPEESNTPTLTMARIKGGAATVPNQCMLYIDRRLIPEEKIQDAITDIKQAVKRVQQNDGDFDVQIHVLHSVDNTIANPESNVVGTLARNIKRVMNVEPKLAVWSYYTEFRYFPSIWGAETVNYSPGLPKVYRGPGEYVVVDDLVGGTKVLALSIMDLTNST